MDKQPLRGQLLSEGQNNFSTTKFVWCPYLSRFVFMIILITASSQQTLIEINSFDQLPKEIKTAKKGISLLRKEYLIAHLMLVGKRESHLHESTREALQEGVEAISAAPKKKNVLELYFCAVISGMEVSYRFVSFQMELTNVHFEIGAHGILNFYFVTEIRRLEREFKIQCIS